MPLGNRQVKNVLHVTRKSIRFLKKKKKANKEKRGSLKSSLYSKI